MKERAVTVALGVFVISFVMCMSIIEKRYNLTFSFIISISLTLLAYKNLSKD